MNMTGKDIILGLLIEKSRSGYEIMKYLKQYLGIFIKPVIE